MKSFQDLILSKKIDVSYLTTHVFQLDDAPSAYNMMMENFEPFIGIVIEYDWEKEFKRKKVIIKDSNRVKFSDIGIGFIGAGSYAQSHLLPNVPKSDKISHIGVMTNSGISSRSVAERFGFEFCTETDEELLNHNGINTVFIATRHDSHAGYVIKALERGKHVFVEKPLCLSLDELENISRIITGNGAVPRIMVGYNRRFSPLAVKMKKCFTGGPVAMTYRVNSGAIPADSWIQDMEIGGGRILGEVCHFIDFMTFVSDALPISVHGIAMDAPQSLNDIVTVSLKYENGSIGSIQYFSNGDKGLAKERVEVFGNGVTAVLDDFKTLTIHSNGKKKTEKLVNQNKGQKEEVSLFIESLLEGTESIIPFNQLYSTSLATFGILESLRNGTVVSLIPASF